jgi:hypothetical protein
LAFGGAQENHLVHAMVSRPFDGNTVTLDDAHSIGGGDLNGGSP